MADAHLNPEPAEASLAVFHEIARALTSSLDLQSILATISHQMERLFRPETWALLLTDDQRKELYCAIADGRFAPRLSDIRLPYGEGLAGWVAERGEAIILPPSPTTDLGENPDPHLGFAVRSAISIPLRSRQQTLGVIQLFNLPPGTLTHNAISFLLALGDFAAIAIQNARAFERVQELTILDECTGLYNLRHFDDVLESEMIRSRRQGLPMSLIFIDLDHFKLVNDEYGHQVGSRLLAEVGATIHSQVRSVDIAFRYGGDEFLVLLPGTAKHEATLTANRLLGEFRTTLHSLPDNLRLGVTASLGIATYPEDGKSGQEILRRADARMYRVKGTTRNGAASDDDEQYLGQTA